MDIYPPAVQRSALLRLAPILDSRPAALRRDGCGDWHILGKTGHVYAAPGGFQLVVAAESARLWSSAKAFLRFAQLTQDGDEGGVFMLDRIPTDMEASAIRRVLGIKKRRHVSPEVVERLRRVPEAAGLAA